MRRAAALATPPNGAAARALAPWIEHALLWLPAVAVFVAIGRYGVDVLWWDDWDSIGRFLLDVRANGLSWPALWVQDNEHRILLGRIFFLADAALGLSPQRLMIASQCVLSAAFALLVPMLRRSVVRWSVAQRSAFLFLSSALFFSFTQYENFFWSVQIGWSLMLFGFLLAMTGVQRERALRTVAGVAISFASTAHWAAAIPVVVAGYGLWAWRRRGTAMFRTAVLRLATMALACAALVVAYTQGWQFPPYHPSPALVVLHPLRLVGFATAELGAPFVWLLARPLLSTATLGGLLFLGAAAKALGDGKLDPHDLVQETFLEAHRHFPRFQGDDEPQLVAWLRQIMAAKVANLVRHYFGTQGRDVRLEQDLVIELNNSSRLFARELVASLTSPSQQAAKREQAVLLADALEHIPEDYREVIILRHLESLPFPEVARRMGRSEDSVQKLWLRGLARLRQTLGERA